jgi:hypothetical protein
MDAAMDYRLYFIGLGGLCASISELQFHDDEAAVEGVAKHVDGRAMELWQGRRYVRSFSAHPVLANQSDAETAHRSPAPVADPQSAIEA